MCTYVLLSHFLPQHVQFLFGILQISNLFWWIGSLKWFFIGNTFIVNWNSIDQFNFAQNHTIAHRRNEIYITKCICQISFDFQSIIEVTAMNCLMYCIQVHFFVSQRSANEFRINCLDCTLYDQPQNVCSDYARWMFEGHLR